MSIFRRVRADVQDRSAAAPQPLCAPKRRRRQLVVGDLGARLDELPGPYGPDPIVFGPGPAKQDEWGW